jgi:hypothetical protein
VRAQGISTAEAVRFRVSSESVPNRLHFTTDPVLRTTDWKLIQRTFQAPAEGGLVEVRLTRTPSPRFDNFIGGRLWIDQVSIRPEAPGPFGNARVTPIARARGSGGDQVRKPARNE